MKKIGITGANGFIGSQLAKELIARGYDVVCFVRKGALIERLPEGCTIKEVDFQDADALSSLFEGFDVIYHCAAQTKARSWNEMYRANVDLTLRIITAVNSCSEPAKIIFLSSQAVSGPAEGMNTKQEEGICLPLTWYGKSKYLAENHLRTRAKGDWLILRPVSVYGAGDKDFLLLFKNMKMGFFLKIGYGETYLNLIYVEELVAKMIELMDEEITQEVLFVGDGFAYTMTDYSLALSKAVDKSFFMTFTIPIFFVKVLALVNEFCTKLTGKLSVLNWEKSKELTARHWICSTDKLYSLVEKNPESKLSLNLKKTYEWYKKNKWI